MTEDTREADAVAEAYSARATEYATLFGAVDVAAPADLHLISRFARVTDGPLLDAGCGPGHWTEHLRTGGRTVLGLDASPGMLAEARERFPGATFQQGTLDQLPVGSAELGGVLAWYSLIHLRPERLEAGLNECARVLRPGGVLLLGFFDGAVQDADSGVAPGDGTEFPHAIVSARFWTVPAMAKRLRAAGFTVVEEHHRQDPGQRPHAAVWAVRDGAPLPFAEG